MSDPFESREHQLLLEATAEVARLRAESVELRNELTSARIQIDGTETAPGLEHYRSEYESITEELSQWEWLNEDEGLSDSVAALCAARNELARELDACKTESAELRRQVTDLTADRDDHRDARKLLATDLSALGNGEPVRTGLAFIVEQRMKAASATGVRLVGPCPTIEAAPRLAVAELASARAQVELTDAERKALERSVEARQAELRLREHHPDNRIQTEHWRRRDIVDVAETLRSHAVDALLALRAKEKAE